MDFNLKTYKRLKIKYYFKAVNFFFFFHGTSLNNENWIKIEQTLVENRLQYFRVYNTLMVGILKDSIFKNLAILIHGPIILLNNENTKLTLKKLKNSNPLMSLLCLKINNKIYSKKQIENLQELSYTGNVFLLYKSMNIFIKKPYYKLKSKKSLLVSK